MAKLDQGRAGGVRGPQAARPFRLVRLLQGARVGDGAERLEAGRGVDIQRRGAVKLAAVLQQLLPALLLNLVVERLLQPLGHGRTAAAEVLKAELLHLARVTIAHGAELNAAVVAHSLAAEEALVQVHDGVAKVGGREAGPVLRRLRPAVPQAARVQCQEDNGGGHDGRRVPGQGGGAA